MGKLLIFERFLYVTIGFFVLLLFVTDVYGVTYNYTWQEKFNTTSDSYIECPNFAGTDIGGAVWNVSSNRYFTVGKQWGQNNLWYCLDHESTTSTNIYEDSNIFSDGAINTVMQTASCNNPTNCRIGMTSFFSHNLSFQVGDYIEFSCGFASSNQDNNFLILADDIAGDEIGFSLTGNAGVIGHPNNVCDLDPYVNCDSASIDTFKITYENLTTYCNYTETQIEDLERIELRQVTGVSNVRGNFSFDNITVQAHYGINDRPHGNFSTNETLICVNTTQEESIINIPLNVNFTDAENDTIMYSFDTANYINYNFTFDFTEQYCLVFCFKRVSTTYKYYFFNPDDSNYCDIYWDDQSIFNNTIHGIQQSKDYKGDTKFFLYANGYCNRPNTDIFFSTAQSFTDFVMGYDVYGMETGDRFDFYIKDGANQNILYTYFRNVNGTIFYDVISDISVVNNLNTTITSNAFRVRFYSNRETHNLTITMSDIGIYPDTYQEKITVFNIYNNDNPTFYYDIKPAVNTSMYFDNFMQNGYYLGKPNFTATKPTSFNISSNLLGAQSVVLYVTDDYHINTGLENYDTYISYFNVHDEESAICGYKANIDPDILDATSSFKAIESSTCQQISSLLGILSPYKGMDACLIIVWGYIIIMFLISLSIGATIASMLAVDFGYLIFALLSFSSTYIGSLILHGFSKNVLFLFALIGVSGILVILPRFFGGGGGGASNE